MPEKTFADRPIEPGTLENNNKIRNDEELTISPRFTNDTPTLEPIEIEEDEYPSNETNIRSKRDINSTLKDNSNVLLVGGIALVIYFLYKSK